LSLEPTTVVLTRTPQQGLVLFVTLSSMFILLAHFGRVMQLRATKANTAFRRSSEQLRLITDALPALISYVDRDERYQFVSLAYERWTNRPREEIIGKSIRELAPGPGAYEEIHPYIKR